MIMKKFVVFLVLLSCSAGYDVKNETLPTTISENKEIISTNTTEIDENLKIDTFENIYKKKYLKETYYLSKGENSVSAMSEWMGEQLYFLEVDKVLSNEEMEALSALSIDGFICEKTFTKDVEGYLDRVHPFKKNITATLTYKCNSSDNKFLFGNPFYLNEKWWIFKSFNFDYENVECETACKPKTDYFATMVKIDESSPIYNLYNPLDIEVWELSNDWVTYLEYMWNIYWLFDWVDIADTKYEIGRDELFSTPAFQIQFDEGYLNCYLYGGVGMTGPDWLQGFFPQPVETVNDSFDEYIWAGSDWSWSCFENQRENEDDAKLYVVGSGPPIQYENTIGVKVENSKWVMYGSQVRPNYIVFEKGVFYPITEFYWFTNSNKPNIQFACDYIKDNNIKNQNTLYEPLYTDCSNQ